MSLAEQLAGMKSRRENKQNSVILAKVTNIEDPESLGRVKCRPLTDNPKVKDTDWCYVMTPAGGSEYGFFFFPQLDDLVLLSYIGGDVHRPMVLGSFWAGETVAPYKIEGGENKVISLKTPTGSELKFEEEENQQKITITTPSGAVIKIDDKDKTMTLQGNDDNSLTINWKDGEIELKAAAKLTLSAGDTTITLESSGNLTGKASQKVNFEGANLELKGSMDFKAKGAQAEIKADGQLSLESSGITKLKGSLVQIN